MTTLFDPLKIGSLHLKNRIIMAPLTRMRSLQPGNVPQKLNAEYYAQRATAGLIISEATQISQQGQGYPATPGIYSQAQIDGWKLITQSVHEKGGKIFLQLWHVGRISHSSFQPDHSLPVGPSAIKPSGKVLTCDWKQSEYEIPHALTPNEIKSIINDYYVASINAKKAGFDGVEIHAANGYLIDQFLQNGTNQRQDDYGGSIENRTKLLIQITESVMQVWDKKQIGVRLSPYGTFNDISDSDPTALFSFVVNALNNLEIGYIHMIEPRATNAGGDDTLLNDAPSTALLFRHLFNGVFISAGGYNPQSAKDAVESHLVDAVAFGRLFIANPDLPHRIEIGAALNKYDRSTFYGGNEKGYTDYPFLNGLVAKIYS